MVHFDLLGIGENTVDVVLSVPHYPSRGGKVAFQSEHIGSGGQIVGAVATAARLGLRTAYIGAVGDDFRATIVRKSLELEPIAATHLVSRQNCMTQVSYIVIDESCGERTVFTHRPKELELTPEDIPEGWVTRCRLLHIDGYDPQAKLYAARLAKENGAHISADFDLPEPGLAEVLPYVDYLVTNSEFPIAWTGKSDLFEALAQLYREYNLKVAAATLGPYGALALSDEGYLYAPGFVVDVVDTTGAGDVFHGTFCYGLLKDMPLAEVLELSNAMAALNCQAVGARAGIAHLSKAQALRRKALRRSHPEIEARAMLTAT